MQGSLTSSYGLADVIRGIYVGRRSGILAVQHGTQLKQLYFERGSFVFSDSSDPNWRFGTLLVRRGKIGQADLDRVLTLLQPGRRIGMALRDLGYLDDAGLNEAVAFQITENVFPAFSWIEGEYEFMEKEEPAPSDIAYSLPTANVIMEGVRRIDDLDLVRRALGATDQVVALGSNPLLRFQSVKLLPNEGFLLSRIDGMLTIDEVSSITPLPEEEVLRLLYGLRCTGILDIHSRETTAAAAGDTDIAGFFADFGGVESLLGGSTLDRSAAEKLDPEEEKEAAEIHEFAARVGDLDHYAVLGVDRGAVAAEIRKAYYRRAKRFHPDRHHRSHLSNLQEKLERVFVRVNEAYETLKDTGSRAGYDRVLRGKTAEAKGPAAPAGPEAEAERRQALAEASFKEGRSLFDRGDIFNAVRSFQIAVQFNPGMASYQSYLGRALGRNPKWRKEAEERLLKAIELEPREAEHYAQMGILYEAAKLYTRADRYFDEALKFNPTNETAHGARARRETGGARRPGR